MVRFWLEEFSPLLITGSLLVTVARVCSIGGGGGVGDWWWGWGGWLVVGMGYVIGGRGGMGDWWWGG